MIAEKEENSVGIVQTRTMRVVEQNKPLELDCGKALAPIDAAYETYGKLNDSGDNAVLVCHALSGNAHVAGFNSTSDRKPGWWDVMVGPGKGIFYQSGHTEALRFGLSDYNYPRYGQGTKAAA